MANNISISTVVDIRHADSLGQTENNEQPCGGALCVLAVGDTDREAFENGAGLVLDFRPVSEPSAIAAALFLCGVMSLVFSVLTS